MLHKPFLMNLRQLIFKHYNCQNKVNYEVKVSMFHFNLFIFIYHIFEYFMTH